MYQIIIIIHVLLGLGIIGLVLMQHGKGADAGAAFGSGASGTVFGAQGSASFLSRTTAIFATLFFVTSLSLAILSGRTGDDSKDLLDLPEDEVPSLPVVSEDTGPMSVPSISDNETPDITVAPQEESAKETAETNQ